MFKEIKREKVYSQILEQVKHNIRIGALKRGDRLPSERQWAEQMGVSRAAVREAIRAMEMIGLIECHQGEGNFISENIDGTLTEPLTLIFWLAECDASEVHSLRRAIEIEGARRAATNMEERDFKKLENLCEQIEKTTSEEEAVIPDMEFHRCITEWSRNPMLYEVLNAANTLMVERISKNRRLIFEKEKDFKRVNQQHRNIIAGLRTHSPEKARAAMAKHMDYIEEFISGNNKK